MAKSRRVYRVAEQIRNTIALELNRVADPRFHLVTITAVVVSPDLRSAKVYWVSSGSSQRRRDVQEAFESAHGYFRRAVGETLGIRFVPELKFFYDDTLDTQEEVERIMARIHED